MAKFFPEVESELGPPIRNKIPKQSMPVENMLERSWVSRRREIKWAILEKWSTTVVAQ